MNITVYSGIKGVGFAADPALIFDRLQPLHYGATVDPQAEFLEVCLAGIGSMQTEAKPVNGETQYTTTVSFYTSDDVPTNRPLCFRLIDKYGRRRLIGTGQQPHPVVTVVDDEPSDPKNPRIKKVTIKWVSTIGYLLCKP